MSTERELAQTVRSWLQDGTEELSDRVFDVVMANLATTPQRPVTSAARRQAAMPTSLKIVAACAAMVAIVAAGISLTSSPNVAAPTPTPVATVQPTGTVDGWPAPLRVERADGIAPVVSAPIEDRVDDAGGLPQADLVGVKTPPNYVGNGSGIVIGVARTPPADRREDLWLGYGLVLDIDADGIPDHQVGMDSRRASGHREWITDLATGETRVNDAGRYGTAAFETWADTFYPGESTFGNRKLTEGLMIVGRECAGPLRFYAWASAIDSGTVAAMDFAPDVGWIETLPGSFELSMEPSLERSLEPCAD